MNVLGGRFRNPNLVYPRQEDRNMNDDLDRPEALYHDIIAPALRNRSTRGIREEGIHGLGSNPPFGTNLRYLIEL